MISITCIWRNSNNKTIITCTFEFFAIAWTKFAWHLFHATMWEVRHIIRKSNFSRHSHLTFHENAQDKPLGVHAKFTQSSVLSWNHKIVRGLRYTSSDSKGLKPFRQLTHDIWNIVSFASFSNSPPLSVTFKDLPIWAISRGTCLSDHHRTILPSSPPLHSFPSPSPPSHSPAHQTPFLPTSCVAQQSSINV